MATTVKTFIVDAADGKTDSDAPYDALATFMASEDDCQLSVTRLNGDRLFIIATKTTS